MAYETIRDYLKTQLTAIVPSIGKIQDYQRYLTKRKTIQAELYLNGVLNVWFIQKVGEKDVWEGPGQLVRTHIINLVGYMAIDDAAASEKTFLLAINNILAKFQSDYTLGDNAQLLTPPALTKCGQQGFINAICHYGLITLSPFERMSL